MGCSDVIRESDSKYIVTMAALPFLANLASMFKSLCNHELSVVCRPAFLLSCVDSSPEHTSYHRSFIFFTNVHLVLAS